jgi:hypothetical protein
MSSFEDDFMNITQFQLGAEPLQSASERRKKRTQYLKDKRQRQQKSNRRVGRNQGAAQAQPVSKAEKRKQDNRNSAERSRKRKADYVNTLEKQLKILRQENMHLQSRLQVYEPSTADAFVYRSLSLGKSSEQQSALADCITQSSLQKKPPTQTQTKAKDEPLAHMFSTLILYVASVVFAVLPSFVSLGQLLSQQEERGEGATQSVVPPTPSGMNRIATHAAVHSAQITA